MAGVGRAGTDKAGGDIPVSLQTTVLANGSPIIVKGSIVLPHGEPPHNVPHVMVGASGTVFAGGIPVCRAGDAASCGHTLTPGSSDVNAG